MVGDDLGLHRHISAGAVLLHNLPPLLHALLGRGQEAAILFACKQRQQRPQRFPAVSDEPDIDRVAEANTGWIDVDLYGLGLARIGIEFEIWEATPGNDQRVALLQGVLRWGRAQQAYSAGRIRASVRHHGLPQESFDNRSSDFL